MSLFDPAATSKSVHDSLVAAYAALPADAKHAIIVDATAEHGERPHVAGFYVHKTDKGWQTVIGGEWDGGDHVSGKVAVMKVWK